MQRDHFIDFVKGITIINVVIIHTVYHSRGDFPDFLRNIVLLVDVPIFFLCSGITSSGNIKKTIVRLFKLQLSFMLFISILFVASSIYQQSVLWRPFLHNIMHHYQWFPPFHSVLNSLWYFQVYFVVALLGSILLFLISDRQRLLNITLFVMFLGVVYSSLTGDINRFDFLSKINFYLFIFLFGFRFKNVYVSKKMLLGTIATIILSLSLFGSTLAIDRYTFRRISFHHISFTYSFLRYRYL